MLRRGGRLSPDQTQERNSGSSRAAPTDQQEANYNPYLHRKRRAWMVSDSGGVVVEPSENKRYLSRIGYTATRDV